jgi:phage tail sheath protein FI
MLLIRDPLTDADTNCPPSGHVAGIYARTDIERGVHKAPANEVIRGITGLARLVNHGQQEILNPSPVNINVLRDFRASGRGYRVWGARCITSDSDWKYVPVRRLFIFLEESIDEGTQWVVFEPNDEPLWARVRASVSAFLRTVWRDGGLQGATPEQAYFVQCDRSTMSQADIDNGRLIMRIGVAPVKPAEFVIFRIGQWTGGSSTEEE